MEVEAEQRLVLARRLVASLESGDARNAESLLEELNAGRSSLLLRRLATLAEEMHQAFAGLISDRQLRQIAKNDIPDARERLSYVIEKTEDAAHQTLSAVESMVPLSEQLAAGSAEMLQILAAPAGADRRARLRMVNFARDVGVSAACLRTGLAAVTMAQSYQDLTGQVIKRTIALVSAVEMKLSALLPANPEALADEPAAALDPAPSGPAMRLTVDVMQQQSDVDSLLADLGV